MMQANKNSRNALMVGMDDLLLYCKPPDVTLVHCGDIFFVCERVKQYINRAINACIANYE